MWIQEQSGSIVTETLTNGILIRIDTSKESDFYPDFKHTSFIKFSLTHQKWPAWENLPYFENRRKHPLKVIESEGKSSIRFSVSENPTVEVSSSYMQKWGILYFLPEERSQIRVYYFFYPGVIVSTQWS